MNLAAARGRTWVQSSIGVRRHAASVWRGLAVAAAAIFVAACSSGGGGGGAVPEDIMVTLTTAGGATTLEAGTTLGLVAQVANAASNPNVTWSLGGAACATDCGTLTPGAGGSATYAAPASVGTAFSVTVTATSVENATKNAAVQLTVNPKACPPNAGLLTGRYAFLLQGFDPATQKGVAAVGALVSDGCGNVVGGSADIGPVPALAAASIGGSYTIGADRRGMLTLNVGGVDARLAVALGQIGAGVAREGALTDAAAGADSRLLTGSIWQQQDAAASQALMAGDYAYLLNGWTSSAGVRWAAGGTVAMNGSGAFASGLQDRMSFNGTASTGVAWSATTTAFAGTSGRAELSAAAFGALGRAVAIGVSATHQLVLVTDTAGSVLSGQMRARTGPFDQASLSGTIVTDQTQNYMGAGFAYMNATVLGVFSADGAAPTGLLTGLFNDSSAGCNVSRDAPVQLSYAVASNGQVSLYNGAALAGRYYLTGANTGFLLGLDASVPVGALRPRAAGPFSVASISGAYVASQAPGAAYFSTNAGGVGSSAGTGTLATTLDTNYSGAVATRSDLVGGLLHDTGSGRFTDDHGNVVYAVSPDTFLVTSISGLECKPVVHRFGR